MNLCRSRAARKRGQAGWRRLRIAYGAEERTGYRSRRHRCFRKTPTLHAQARSREALSCKERTSMAWPRRCYRGLYRYEESFPSQGLWGHAAAPVGPPFPEVPALLTLGGIPSTETGSECDIEHRRSHRAARQDLVDLALRRTPKGGCKSGRGFLPAVSLTL